MLTLMNNARLGVAAQGIGIAEAALDSAVRYARERRQFGAPIADQPLMKNLLARMVTAPRGQPRAPLPRLRASSTATARSRRCSRAAASPRPERAEWEAIRERNEMRIRLLTPLAKYLATETCDDITRSAIQVHGGLGFMAESVPGKLHARRDHHHDLRGHLRDPGLLRAEGGRQGRARASSSTTWSAISPALTRPELAPYAERVRRGIEQVLAAGPALAADIGYALLSAQSLAESVISVVVSGELLRQAEADPGRFDVAASWIERRMVDLEGRTERIRAGSADLIERCARMIEQAVPA